MKVFVFNLKWIRFLKYEWLESNEYKFILRKFVQQN